MLDIWNWHFIEPMILMLVAFLRYFLFVIKCLYTLVETVCATTSDVTVCTKHSFNNIAYSTLTFNVCMATETVFTHFALESCWHIFHISFRVHYECECIGVKGEWLLSFAFFPPISSKKNVTTRHSSEQKGPQNHPNVWIYRVLGPVQKSGAPESGYTLFPEIFTRVDHSPSHHHDFLSLTWFMNSKSFRWIIDNFPLHYIIPFHLSESDVTIEGSVTNSLSIFYYVIIKITT